MTRTEARTPNLQATGSSPSCERLRGTLQLRKSELEEMLLACAKQRQRHAYEAAQWNAEFGQAHLVWRKIRDDLELVIMKLSLLEAEPTLSMSELDLAVADEVERRAAEHAAAQRELQRLPAAAAPPVGSTIDPETMRNHVIRIKQTLLEIHRWCHSALDVVDHRVPPEIAEQIREIWVRTPAPKTVDLTCHPDSVGYTYPDATSLMLDHARLQEILREVGIEVATVGQEPEALGEAERVAWLEQEIGFHEAALENATDEYARLRDDEAARRRRAELAAPELYDELRCAILEEAEAFSQEQLNCEEALASRLGRVS